MNVLPTPPLGGGGPSGDAGNSGGNFNGGNGSHVGQDPHIKRRRWPNLPRQWDNVKYVDRPLDGKEFIYTKHWGWGIRYKHDKVNLEYRKVHAIIVLSKFQDDTRSFSKAFTE